MATKLTIANMALGFLAEERQISSLETTTNNADATTMDKYYKASKEMTLSALDWKFARKRRVKLALLENFMENDSDVYVWAYPRDFITKPKVYSTSNANNRYKVPFDSYSDESGRAVLETCVPDCTIDYNWDIPEERYFPRLDVLQAYKLAELARNEIILGDGAITVNKLRENFNTLLAEMGESEYQLSDTQAGTINTFEEARNEFVRRGTEEY